MHNTLHTNYIQIQWLTFYYIVTFLLMLLMKQNLKLAEYLDVKYPERISLLGFIFTIYSVFVENRENICICKRTVLMM